MGIQKRYLREVDTAGSYSKLQTLTSTDTATEINPYGVTLITSASTDSTNAFDLGDITVAGVHKYIAVTLGTTDAVVINTNSTTTTFWGSTNNTATASTGAGEKALALVAATTSSWAVVGQTTGWTFSASTG